MDSAALYRLMAWLSPSYPVGAFSYSHGLEWLVETGELCDCDTMVAWISDLVAQGSGRNDAILLAQAWRAAQAGDRDALDDINALGCAFVAGAERQLETTAQGTAFADITTRTWDAPTLAALAQNGTRVAYPVAVGVAAADHAIALGDVIEAYLHAFAANLVSAGLRLVPLGQTDGQRAMVALEEVLRTTAEAAREADLDALGGSVFRADMASLHHETQYTRLFRT